MRLLIIEDEPVIGMELVYVATSLGFEVDGPATNASDALEVASARSPSIALVDVNLADGPTGPYIASQLSSLYGTKVIMVTANSDLVLPGIGGIAAVMSKPHDPAKLASVLRLLASASKCC